MTDKELRAIQELVMDNSIIIRPADKGSGIAIIDTDEYINKIEKELQDTTTYKQTDRDITKDVAKKAEKIVNRLHRNGYITKDMKNYMLPKNARPGKVKGNPKIHKPDIPYRIISSIEMRVLEQFLTHKSFLMVKIQPHNSTRHTI